MKKILLVLVTAVLTSIDAIARDIDIGSGLIFVVPDSLKVEDSKSFVFAGYDKTCFVAISKIDKQDFSTDKVKSNLDRLIFNLKDYVETDSESDGLFEFGKDYKIKFYSDSKGNKVATYTSYVYEFPYCILIDYTDDTAIQTLRDIAESEQYKSSWWHVVWTFGCRDAGVLALTFLLYIIVCMPISNSKFGFVFGLCVAIFVCTPLWGLWGAWLFYIALGAIFGACASSGNLETVLNGVIEGLG